MKLAPAVLSAVALLGCSSPPTVSPTSPGRLWVMAISNGGGCVADATIDILIAQAVLKSVAQEAPCSVWDYAGGATFTDLPHALVTIRASAPGFDTKELSVMPATGPALSVTEIVLTKTP